MLRRLLLITVLLLAFTTQLGCASKRSSEVSPNEQIESKMHYREGTNYLNQGVYDRAERKFKQALEINPNFAHAHFKLGELYLQTGRRDLALERQKTLDSLDPVMAAKLRKMF